VSGVLRVAAPAKVNLALQVLGRRPDGYHELRTLFQAIDLCDELELVPTAGSGIELRIVDAVGAGLPVAAGEDNLVVRAARAVLAATGRARGLRFALRKRIPAGGGLGGGSSDAAAALRLTNRALGDPLPAEQLAALAVGLGADVPFFLRGATCVGEGIGERLRAVPDAPRLEFVLVLPPFGSSTRAVFELLAAGLIEPCLAATVRPFEPPTATEIATMMAAGNELEEPALRATPGLRELRDAIRAAGVGDVRMSGSGSTLFVARETAGAADAVAARLAGPAFRSAWERSGGGALTLLRARSLAGLPEIEAAAGPADRPRWS
jgi:4-diphosphocytidyl-2-C-methyl-D-erythritol kinase